MPPTSFAPPQKSYWGLGICRFFRVRYFGAVNGIFGGVHNIFGGVCRIVGGHSTDSRRYDPRANITINSSLQSTSNVHQASTLLVGTGQCYIYMRLRERVQRAWVLHFNCSWRREQEERGGVGLCKCCSESFSHNRVQTYRCCPGFVISEGACHQISA